MNTGRSTSTVRPACTMGVIIFLVPHIVTALRKTKLHLVQKEDFVKCIKLKILKGGQRISGQNTQG